MKRGIGLSLRRAGRAAAALWLRLALATLATGALVQNSAMAQSPTLTQTIAGKVAKATGQTSERMLVNADDYLLAGLDRLGQQWA